LCKFSQIVVHADPGVVQGCGRSARQLIAEKQVTPYPTHEYVRLFAGICWNQSKRRVRPKEVAGGTAWVDQLESCGGLLVLRGEEVNRFRASGSAFGSIKMGEL